MTTITYLTTIHFDFGARRKLGRVLASENVRRPLIVTDQGIVAAGLVDMVREGLVIDPVVFAGTPSNPTEEAAGAGLAAYAEGGCDAIVGLGGGSALDQAKAIAVLVTNPAPLSQYAYFNAGFAPKLAPLPPLVLMPTTAGTGSEVGRAAVLIFSNGRKSLLV